MKSIYASKLYRSSSRKKKIAAALVNSTNRGLVQQLADSLDEQYQRKELVDPESALESKQNSQSDGLPENLSPGKDSASFNPSTDLVSYPTGGGGSSDGMFFSDEEDSQVPEEAEFTDADIQDEEPVEEVTEESTEEVTESTKVKACTCLDTDALNVLKNGLNSVQNISGVTRIVMKENELWIYYDDNMNLNNMMTDVIDYVIQRHPGVDFNRLARSDNAIVFEFIDGTAALDEPA